MKKLAIAVIVLIMIIAICVFAFNKDNEATKAENTTENEIINEEVNEQIDTVVENEIINETQNTQVTENNQNEVESSVASETFEEEPATAEQKAINIVKEDWKETSDAEITVEGMNENGEYIVVVRNSKTTQALAFYSVNVSNKTFNKREMN